MPTSYNGWTASPSSRDINLTPLVVDGVAFVPGVRGGDVHTVLEYVAQQVNDRVEKATNPGCWGYAYRENRNAANLSNHASGTAFDFNAPKHPNGVATSRTWSAQQVAEIHHILAEVDNVVRWGGDYTKTVDSMHFEINAGPDAVARVAAKINGCEVKPKRAPVISLPNVQMQARMGGRRALGAVKVIQRRLNRKYRAGLTVDGLYGAKTRAAYRQHQARIGSPLKYRDGIPGPTDLRKLVGPLFIIRK